MATKYSDIIRIRAGKPAYNIEEERGQEWTSFIPNEQFNNVLKIVLRAVRGNDIDVHKSFWVNGTYGTGKSHAAAVIAHLLGDPVDEIRQWVDYEYGDQKFDLIRNSLYKLRESKRLLMVRMKGMVNLTHVSELAPVVQTKVTDALGKNGIEMEVDTDYDTLLRHVQEHEVIWDDLIRRNVSLSTIVADRGMLLKKLKDKDQATLRKAHAALRDDAGMMVMLPQENLGDWLLEVQNRLRQTTDFTGLLILWDEFTEVMEDAVGISVLKALQAVSEKFMNEENDSFIFLISHPSAFNNLGTEATQQTDGRYHRMKYNMESVSAFKIMSRKFEIVDADEHNLRREFFYGINSDLIELYTAKSNDKQETRTDLYNLFPIHPGTANLATHYATTVGSSSRSVFEFIGDNEKMRQFLDDEQAYANKDTITADFLWDFVLKEFSDDVADYGAVTERWNTYKHRVEHQGPATEAVFKAILLLNAFNNVAADDSVTPTEENVRHLFAGTRYAAEIDEALNWINEEGVVQRAPGGIFSVQFSALPPHELEEIKQKLYDDDYRFTSQVLKFGNTAREFFEKKYEKKVIRSYVFDFFSEGLNDSMVKNSIKTAKRNARPSQLSLILFYARDNNELAHLRELAEECSKAGQDGDKELGGIVYIVVDTPFGKKNYDRFIEYMASYTAAGNHGFMDQVNVHRDHAVEMIREWMQTAVRGNATLWVNGESFPISLKHLSSSLNNVVAPLIFPKGPDAHEMLRHKAPTTFWKPQVSKEIIRTFIFAQSRTDLQEVSGVMKPIQYLIQDALDENLEWKPDIPEEHQFRAVFDYVNNTIRNFISHGNTAVLFDLCERFDDLTKPPYGLSGNYASAACVAFAMRPWVNKIYDSVGKPRTADNLADDIASLIRCWENGRTTNKLGFKFQTPQEGKLCKELTRLFRLDRLQGYSDISSMKDARFAITGVYVEQKGYPLWSLKYMTDDFINSYPRLTMDEDVKCLIDNIVAICEEKDQKNVQLVTSTLDLISNYRVDFPDILSKAGAFENGFHHFLMLQPGVQLQEEEIGEALTFIRQNLQSTVGYWTELEVIDRLKDWRISQALEHEEVKRLREEEELEKWEEESRPRIEEERKKFEEELARAKELVGNSDNVPRKKAQARERIDSISDPGELRAIIDKVIDLGYEQILDIILNKE